MVRTKVAVGVFPSFRFGYAVWENGRFNALKGGGVTLSFKNCAPSEVDHETFRCSVTRDQLSADEIRMYHLADTLSFSISRFSVAVKTKPS